jgi:hypothetical protein
LKLPRELQRYTLETEWDARDREERRRRLALEEFRKRTEPSRED